MLQFRLKSDVTQDTLRSASFGFICDQQITSARCSRQPNIFDITTHSLARDGMMQVDDALCLALVALRSDRANDLSQSWRFKSARLASKQSGASALSPSLQRLACK